MLFFGDLNELLDVYVCFVVLVVLVVLDIFFGGLILEVCVVCIGGKLVVNLFKLELEGGNCDIDLIVVVIEMSIVMVEGEMNEVSEVDMFEVIVFVYEVIKK